MDKWRGLTEEFFSDLALEIVSELGSMKTTKGRSELLKLPERLIYELDDISKELKSREKKNEGLPIGAEWLLDNYYVLEKNLKLFKKLYTRKFDQALPKVEYEGKIQPRIFVVVSKILQATNQSVTYNFLHWTLDKVSVELQITLAELWALKEILRIALIVNLVNVFRDIRIELEQKSFINSLFNLLKTKDRLKTEKLLEFMNSLLKNKDLIHKHPSFILANLREFDQDLTIGVALFELYLKESKIDVEEQLRKEQFELAERQLLISESFHSLNELETLDFSELLESVSLLHKICSNDQLYMQSDFYSRNKVRTFIEKIAKSYSASEFEVGRLAIDFSKKNDISLFDCLIGDFKVSFFNECFGVSPFRVVLNFSARFKLLLYLGTVFVFSALCASFIVFSQLDYGQFGFWLPLLFLVFLTLFFELGIQLANTLILRLKNPRFIPRLDTTFILAKNDWKAAVVTHHVAETVADIASAIDSLVVRAHSQGDDSHLVWFALFDVRDSKVEVSEQYLRQLNDALQSECFKARKERSLKIFGLIRKPTYSNTMNCYIGWERKRGKLVEFLALIRNPNASTTFFEVSVELREELENVKYVITLDADTMTPRDSIIDLVAYAEHPFNKPKVENGIAVKGYSIFQPRININFQSYLKTYFSRLMSDSEGFDPYTKEVSDLYFDLFGEANFLGKGLIVVDAFTQTKAFTLDEERILSHDLLESIYARCAFVSPVEFFDDVPSTYHSYTKRLHRWFRGDWQLLPWIFKGDVSALGKWKLFDNLRRSLIPACIFLAISLVSFVSIKATKILLVSVFLIFAFPLVVSFSQFFSLGPRNITFTQKLAGLRTDFNKVTGQALFWFSVLPHQAFNSLHACVVTLMRLVSKKNLLEWTSFSFVERQVGRLYLIPVSLIQVGFGSILLISSVSVPGKLIGLMFLTAPIQIWFLDRALQRRNKGIPKQIEEYFVKLAFEIFLYFYTHLKAERNWLIPDNLQLVPDKRIAERTSPTNIGYSLISLICGYRLGIIDLKTTLSLLRNILTQVDSLDKFFGHLFNWYETRSKKVLSPRYISFADSGNFLACLVVIEAFLNSAHELPLIHPEACRTFKILTGLDPRERLSASQLTSMPTAMKVLIEKISDLLVRFPNAMKEKGQNLLTDLDEDIRIGKALVEKLVAEMDFSIIFNREKKLFSIGYNVDSARRDSGCYDFLCSEARLSYFTVIALYGYSSKLWFQLNRIVGQVHGFFVPLSWSGTMFEYLMPELFLRTYEGSFIGHGVESAVQVQRAYGRLNRIPWGISESAYGFVDLSGNFQYKAFGVPGLGLKRGLSEDLVVAPYASIMAVSFDPFNVFKNLVELESKYKARGEFGFVEAVDFSRDRLAKDQDYFVVDAFFAHHQGMSLTALINFLFDDHIKQLFHSDPRVGASESLLFEKKPKVMVTVSVDELLYNEPERAVSKPRETTRVIKTPFTGNLKTHFVSNSQILSLVDAGGGGFVYAPELDIFLTRWRKDPTKNQLGYYIYIIDDETRDIFSAGYLPTKKIGELYEVFYAPDKFEIKQRQNSIFSYLEGTVSPTLPVEIRKLSITNLGPKTKQISVVSYGEVCLSSLRADSAHPAFQKLFITSEIIKEKDMLLFHRRPRSHREKDLFLGHRMIIKQVFKPTEFETDRLRFLGRGRDEENPIFFEKLKLENSEGVVLDPIFSIKQSLRILP
ncbi:MAG: hypothetical protein NZO16_02605, partial [Deltaproteobacteria bacterium]|nr:hypothetical protein [Deltaproteobacteria bacterium]